MDLLLNIFIHHIGFRRLSKSSSFAGANHSYQLIADCPLFHWTSLAANGNFRDFQNILMCTFWLHSDQGRTSNPKLQRSPYLTTFQQHSVHMLFLTSQAPPALPLCMVHRLNQIFVPVDRTRPRFIRPNSNDIFSSKSARISIFLTFAARLQVTHQIFTRTLKPAYYYSYFYGTFRTRKCSPVSSTQPLRQHFPGELRDYTPLLIHLSGT